MQKLGMCCGITTQFIRCIALLSTPSRPASAGRATSWSYPRRGTRRRGRDTHAPKGGSQEALFWETLDPMMTTVDVDRELAEKVAEILGSG